MGNMVTNHTDDEDRRTTAEFSDPENPAEAELLPPEVRVKGDDVPEMIVSAVEAALAEEPNAVDVPVLMDGERFNDRALAVLGASFNELPAMDEDGGLSGWRPAYVAREHFEAALAEALPDGLFCEAHNNHQTGIYSEGGR